jgi:hypothetical protein
VIRRARAGDAARSAVRAARNRSRPLAWRQQA